MVTEGRKDARPAKKRQRTCIGCRAVREKSELVRFVEHDGALRPDPCGIFPGRGAYLCRSEACLSSVLKKKDAFSRALRRKVSGPDLRELSVSMSCKAASGDL